ncbi:MAG: capsular polysaccharide synthesis protein [Pseudomonadales bacterium]|nr:capsular polysaccharide synthesis protein [Pseudomonadales bacterium]
MQCVVKQERSDYQEPSNDQLNIWLYWENIGFSVMPPYLKLCIETLRHHCKSSIIHLVTPDNLDLYLPDLDMDLSSIRMRDTNKTAISLKADYLRVKLLYEYGGLWQDVDCIALKDYSETFKNLLVEYDFIGMRKHSKGLKPISNNFIASRQGGAVISAYLDQIEAHINLKKMSQELYEWNEIGSGMLTPIVDRQSADKIFLFEESHIHPFDFTESEKLQEVDPKFFFEDRVDSRALCVMLYHSLFSKSTKALPRREILNSEMPLSQMIRYSLSKDASGIIRAAQKISNGESTRDFECKDIAIIFTTMGRPECCRNFLESIRRYWGNEVNIYFAVQGDVGLRGVYSRMSKKYLANIFYLDEDAGLSASRNFLVENTKEKLILLSDDDFVVTQYTRLDVALNIFNENLEVDILGGMFYNYYYDKNGNIERKEYTAFNHNFLAGDFFPKNELLMLPTEYKSAKRDFLDHRYFWQRQDTVNNFCLMDRKVFSEKKLHWDDSMKIMGEHEDFYCQAYFSDLPIGIYYTNALCIDHDRRQVAGFDEKRSRLDGQIQFMKKWGFDKFKIIGKRQDALKNKADLDRKLHPEWLNKVKNGK